MQLRSNKLLLLFVCVLLSFLIGNIRLTSVYEPVKLIKNQETVSFAENFSPETTSKKPKKESLTKVTISDTVKLSNPLPPWAIGTTNKEVYLAWRRWANTQGNDLYAQKQYAEFFIKKYIESNYKDTEAFDELLANKDRIAIYSTIHALLNSASNNPQDFKNYFSALSQKCHIENSDNFCREFIWLYYAYEDEEILQDMYQLNKKFINKLVNDYYYCGFPPTSRLAFKLRVPLSELDPSSSPWCTQVAVQEDFN